MDKRSQKNIQTLKPEVQVLALKLIETAQSQGINAQGRTKPGQVVTKARGGYSWHNFGLAFDIGIFSQDGKQYYGESPDYAVCGKIGESLGLEWGGSWPNFKDEPHFQMNPKGYTLAQLRERSEKGEDLFT